MKQATATIWAVSSRLRVTVELGAVAAYKEGQGEENVRAQDTG